MTQTFLAIQDKKIVGRFVTAQGIEGVRKSLAEPADIVEIPDNSPAQTGLDVGFFDKQWQYRPPTALLADGLITLLPTEKIVDEKVVLKSLGELITEGIEVVPVGMIYDAKTDSIIPDPAYVPPKPTLEELQTELAALITRAKVIEEEISSVLLAEPEAVK